jgi:hypothetical protein
MATVTINILDSNGNVIDTKEIDESSLAVYQQYYNVQTLESQPTTQEQTFQIMVYELDDSKPSGFKTEYFPQATIAFQQSLISQGKLFYEGNQHQVPSLEFIQNHYGYTEPMAETKQIIVFDLDINGQLTSQYYATATIEFIQNLISQNKLFYEGSQVETPALEFVRNHYGYVEPTPEPTPTPTPEPIPEPVDNPTVNYPMVSQLGVEFELKNNRVTGRVVLNKITSNWNPYYNDRNLISYFELKTPNGIAIGSLGQVKQNIVKFPPSQPPLLPTQELTFDESAENYKALQVKIYLWTEDNNAIAEPLVFTVKEDSVPIDVVNPSDTTAGIKNDNFLAKGVGIFGGLLGISLLLTGLKSSNTRGK